MEQLRPWGACEGWTARWSSRTDQREWLDAAPFVHPHPHDTATSTSVRLWRWVKGAVGAAILLPVRVAVLVPMLAAYIVIAWLLSSTLCRGRGRGRRTAQRAVARLFLGAGFAVGGVRLRVSGRRQEGTNTIVSNHCSYLDVLVHAYLTFPSFVAKRGVRRVWYWGFLSRMLDCVYVAHPRSSTEEGEQQRIHSGTDLIVERQRDEDQDRAPLLIFPEGTTTNGRCMGGVPVQPVVLRYRYRHFSPTWESIPVWVHVFWLLASFVHYVDVIFLPTYKPSKIERANPQIYAANVQRMMSEAAGVPAVQQTIESKLRHHERIMAGRLRALPHGHNHDAKLTIER